MFKGLQKRQRSALVSNTKAYTLPGFIKHHVPIQNIKIKSPALQHNQIIHTDAVCSIERQCMELCLEEKEIKH